MCVCVCVCVCVCACACVRVCVWVCVRASMRASTDTVLTLVYQAGMERASVFAEDMRSQQVERDHRVQAVMQAGASACSTAQSLESRVKELLCELEGSYAENRTLQSQCTCAAHRVGYLPSTHAR